MCVILITGLCFSVNVNGVWSTFIRISNNFKPEIVNTAIERKIRSGINKQLDDWINREKANRRKTHFQFRSKNKQYTKHFNELHQWTLEWNQMYLQFSLLLLFYGDISAILCSGYLINSFSSREINQVKLDATHSLCLQFVVAFLFGASASPNLDKWMRLQLYICTTSIILVAQPFLNRAKPKLISGLEQFAMR